MAAHKEMKQLKAHPIADIFPMMSGEEWEDHVEDVRENGVRIPITLYEGMILDGRNRYKAAQECGIECPMIEYEGNDPLGFISSLNIKRRHLNKLQCAAIAAELCNIVHGHNQYEARTYSSEENNEEDRQNCRSYSVEEAAKAMGVSPRTVGEAKRVMREDPEAHERAKRGFKSAFDESEHFEAELVRHNERIARQEDDTKKKAAAEAHRLAKEETERAEAAKRAAIEKAQRESDERKVADEARKQAEARQREADEEDARQRVNAASEEAARLAAERKAREDATAAKAREDAAVAKAKEEASAAKAREETENARKAKADERKAKEEQARVEKEVRERAERAKRQAEEAKAKRKEEEDKRKRESGTEDKFSETQQQKFDRLLSKEMERLRSEFRIEVMKETIKNVDSALARIVGKFPSEKAYVDDLVNKAKAEKNLYESLQASLPRLLSKDDYRFLLQLLHPDRAPEGFTEKFRKAFDIIRAWDTYVTVCENNPNPKPADFFNDKKRR